MKGLTVAPPEYCGAALCALFGLVSCRVDELQQQELQVLSRICAARMGYSHSKDYYLSREELRSCCHDLSGMACTTAGDMTQPFCGNMAWMCIPMTAATSSAMAVDARSPTAREVPLRPEGVWYLPETPAQVPSSGSESESTSDEDVASVKSSGAVDKSNVPLKPEGVWELPETPVRVLSSSCDSESTTDEEIASVKSATESSGTEKSFGKAASEMRWVCSVKNSFVHVEYTSADGESTQSTDAGDGDDSWDGSQLSASTRSGMRRSSSSPGLIESQ